MNWRRLTLLFAGDKVRLGVGVRESSRLAECGILLESNHDKMQNSYQNRIAM